MQSSNNKRTLHLQVHASGLGGTLEGPLQKLIPVQASVSLPPVGGFATARSEAFNLDELVSCTSAHSRASGRIVHEDGSCSVLVTSVIEGLNILEVVTAERIVVQLSVEFPATDGELRVYPAGSHFEQLRIGGFNAAPKINESLLRGPNTWREFQAAGHRQADKLIQGLRSGQENNPDDWLKERYGWMTSDKQQGNGLFLCSLVDGLGCDVPARSLGHTIEIANFGRIFLAEVLVSRSSVQLSMIRAELGCHVHGGVSAGTGVVALHTVPPSHPP